MATTYDDILSRAAEDMLTDTSEDTSPLPLMVWCVEIDSPYPSCPPSIHLFLNHSDAVDFDQSIYQGTIPVDTYIYQLEVR